jgi:hypothetical protein
MYMYIYIYNYVFICSSGTKDGYMEEYINISHSASSVNIGNMSVY